MSLRPWQERVEDILDAVAEVQSFTQGMDFDGFRDDRRTIKAVALDFIVIGEAAGHVPESVAQAHPEIPWAVMRGMRNRLVHAYFSIDPRIVWDTLRNDLPPLVEPLRKLLEVTP